MNREETIHNKDLCRDKINKQFLCDKETVETVLKSTRHDVCDIVNGIHGFTSLIKMEIVRMEKSENAENILEYANYIIENIEQITEQIKSRLTYENFIREVK